MTIGFISRPTVWPLTGNRISRPFLATTSGSSRGCCEKWSITITVKHRSDYSPMSRSSSIFFIEKALLGYTIPLNVFGPGLSIAHRGTIVVSRWARIGENCRIHACVNIRTAAGYADKAPWTGDSVYIGPGAKIFGDIRIGDGVAIGVNAVVNASFGGPGISIAAFLRKKSTIMDRKGC